MYSKNYLLFLPLLILANNLLAQINVSGTLYLGEDPINIVALWQVDLYDENELLGSIQTNEAGQFFFTVDTEVTTEEEWNLQVLDFCSGTLTSTPVTIFPGINDYEVLLQVCPDINPPPPQDTCQAFFSVMGNESNPSVYEFTNLSTTSEELDSLRWDFGDGTSSTVENPTHEFGVNGNYTVTLTVYAGECTATAIQLVIVFNPAECDCPSDIETVCVINFFGFLLSFDNVCFAECAGYDPASTFSCDGDCPCPNFESEVCVIDAAGDTITFTNHCFAECEGYTAEDWINCGSYNGPCNCENVPYDPVCVGFQGGFLTFDNACEAACYGFDGPDIYDCDEQGNCECPDFYDPICVLDVDGDTLTFDNICYAECEGYSSADWFTCEISICACQANNDPVCVLADPIIGLVFNFPNECVANCSGYFESDFLDDCEFTCDCPSTENPVCVLTSSGILAAFNNSCEAACYGFTEEDFVDCSAFEDPTACQCTDSFNPVCVLTETGDTISFQNPCLASCEGYEQEDLVLCNGCPCEGPNYPACYDDPVSGEVIIFENICEALCDGYPQEDLFYCFLPDECMADFTFIPLSEDGLEIRFEDLSIADPAINSWDWDFGDGATSIEETPIHTYTEPGFYEVTLTVGGETCVATITKTIIIGEGAGSEGPQCQAFIFFEQPDEADLLTYQFVDISLGNVSSWVWDFGDGNSSFSQNPIHTYDEAGSYNVALTIFTEDDCESTFIIAINAGTDIWYGDLDCRAWFLPVLNPELNQVYLFNLSSFDATGYFWEFGDGGTSFEYEPFYEYAASGVYTITLTISTPIGCSNSFSVTIDLDGNNFTTTPTYTTLTSTSSVTNPEQFEVRVAPNPTRDQVNLSWETTSSGTYNWILYDINGTVLQQNSGQSTNEVESIQLELAPYPSGIYLVQLQTPDGARTLRLSKL